MINESDNEKIIAFPGKRDRHYYTQLLGKHLQFIENQIFIALKMIKIGKPMQNSFRMEDEAVQIFNTLVDKLKANDFRIIKQFKSRSKFTTYLSSIISREVVNMIRKKRGRNRGKERAKALGEIGEKIYELAIVGGYSVEETCEKLNSTEDTAITLREVETIVKKIIGSRRAVADVENQAIIKEGQIKRDDGELIVIDRSLNPEDQLITNEGKEKTREALKKVLSSLSREERLLLKMRFPADENEEPLDMDTISRILKANKKTIYSRLSRLIKKCRQMILTYGITIDDYFN